MWDSESTLVKQVLDACSKGCENVEELVFIGSESRPDAFDKFIAQNKPSLSYVSLYIEKYDYQPGMYRELVQPFLNSSSSLFLQVCIDNVVSENNLDKFKEFQLLIQGRDGPCFP